MSSNLPPTFNLTFHRLGRATHQLTASQVLALPRKQAFVFFEDPRNLFDITPGWLSFVMKDRDQMTAMFDGAEFDYTIRWLGIPMPWKSRIIGYKPHEQFTDVQLKGPYRSWSHLHRFEDVSDGTLMVDTVTYQLPLGPLGNLAHTIAVRAQLDDIFRYRAMRIDEWTRGDLKQKLR